MAEQQWHYAAGGKPLGPIPQSDLQERLRRGQLAPGTLVWTEGMGDWRPANTLDVLQGSTPPAAAVPPEDEGYGPTDAEPDSATLQSLRPVEPKYAPGGAEDRPRSDRISTRGYAGFWRRFVAYIIDAIVIQTPFVLFGFVFGFTQGMQGQEVLFPPQLEALLNVLGFVGGWLYFALLESSRWQATLGKMALGIVVTDQRGRRISFLRATGRYFAKIVSALIFLIGFIMAAFTQRKQGLHDMMASTLVVRRH